MLLHSCANGRHNSCAHRSEHFSRGHCHSAISGEHAEEPSVQPSNASLHKTELCKYFLSGRCKRSSVDCHFAHGESELQQAPGRLSCSSCGVALCLLDRVCLIHGHVHAARSDCTFEARTNAEGVSKAHCSRERCGKELGPLVGTSWLTLKHKGLQVFPDGAKFYINLQDWVKSGELTQRCSDKCEEFLGAQSQHQSQKKEREKAKKAKKKADASETAS